MVILVILINGKGFTLILFLRNYDTEGLIRINHYVTEKMHVIKVLVEVNRSY